MLHLPIHLRDAFSSFPELGMAQRAKARETEKMDLRYRGGGSQLGRRLAAGLTPETRGSQLCVAAANGSFQGTTVRQTRAEGVASSL